MCDSCCFGVDGSFPVVAAGLCGVEGAAAPVAAVGLGSVGLAVAVAVVVAGVDGVVGVAVAPVAPVAGVEGVVPVAAECALVPTSRIIFAFTKPP